jgi:lipid II:glycine glycyltransferase (peptidoglycan interpeptide bridge formation enzyme)
MIIRKLDEKDKDNYFLAVDHPLQSWQWGEFRQHLGKKVERVGIFDGSRLMAGWQLFFHQIPNTSYTVGYFPKGPPPTREMIDSLKDLARENKAIFIKLEPNEIRYRWQNNKGELDQKRISQKTADCQNLGLVPAVKQLFDQHTFHLDLEKSEADILANMHPKTRYNIRLATKKGVSVETDNSNQGLAIFLSLLFTETVKRQGFYMHNQDYFKKMWSVLEPSEIAHLLLAKHKDEALSAWMLFAFKDWLYYPYGASSSKMRNVMASNLICWETIKLGKKMGLKKFDMWGGLPPDADLSHPWYGFHKFKLGYGGDLVEYSGSWDLVLNEPLYKLYNFADKARWGFLKLKTKLGG